MVGDGPKQERSERTRAHIIETAAVAFAEHGFDGVSLNDLVTASGLSKGAFYFHFSSKEDIALAAFRSKQREMVSLQSAPPASTKASERLASTLRNRARVLRKDPSFRCITRLGSHFNLHSTPGSVYASYLDERLGAIAGLVASGQRQGEFHIGIDPDAAARTIFASIVGMDSMSHVSSAGRDIEVRTEELIDLLLHGLLKSSPSPKPQPRARSEAGGSSTAATRSTGRTRASTKGGFGR